jgi:hypothetical protein
MLKCDGDKQLVTVPYRTVQFLTATNGWVPYRTVQSLTVKTVKYHTVQFLTCVLLKNSYKFKQNSKFRRFCRKKSSANLFHILSATTC